MEADIAASKDHWTELEPMKDAAAAAADLAEINSEVFRRLQREYLGFFQDWDASKWRLGRKIAEDGQAEIFELEGDLHGDGRFLLKVFKEGSSLDELQKQWPLGGMLGIQYMLIVERNLLLPHYFATIYDGVLFKDERFAFSMRKYWGDLRKLIDLKMQNNRNQSPPFTDEVAFRCMVQIAKPRYRLQRGWGVYIRKWLLTET